MSVLDDLLFIVEPGYQAPTAARPVEHDDPLVPTAPNAKRLDNNRFVRHPCKCCGVSRAQRHGLCNRRSCREWVGP